MDKEYQCYQMGQLLSLVPIVSDMHGVPMAYAVAAAGPDVCSKLRDLLPREKWSSTSLPAKAGGHTLGMSAIVQGREECLMLRDLQRTLREVTNND
jgi:hypothetical protein